MKAVTKLIPASALALTLVVFTSCRIENIVPELEPYLKEVTGSDSTSFMSALSAAQPGSSNTDFKEGFKSGYAAGYAEAAKKYIGSAQATPTYSSSVQTVAAASTPSYSSSVPVAATAVASNSKIPSWGYTSNATATVSQPTSTVKKKPSYSSKSSSSSRYSRSRRSCAGGS